MYKYAITLTTTQLANVSVTEGSENTVIINSITYNPQVIGVSIITIPPVGSEYVLKYPTCKNFIKDIPVVIRVLHTQSHEVSVVSTLNSGFYLVTNIATSHIPRISELPGIISGVKNSLVSPKTFLDPTVSNTLNGMTYIPSEISDIITAPPTEFSMRSYWLATKDRMFHSESQCEIDPLISKYCDSNGGILPSNTEELVRGDLSKSHLIFKNTLDVFNVTSMWPTPPTDTIVVNGLRVEYNSVSNPDFLTLFIKKDWREF